MNRKYYVSKIGYAVFVIVFLFAGVCNPNQGAYPFFVNAEKADQSFSGSTEWCGEITTLERLRLQSVTNTFLTVLPSAVRSVFRILIWSIELSFFGELFFRRFCVIAFIHKADGEKDNCNIQKMSYSI